jgi:hypothetical protein
LITQVANNLLPVSASQIIDEIQISRGEMRYLLAQAHRWIAEAMIMEDDFKSAEVELLQAEDLNRKIGSPRLEMDIHTVYVKLRQRGGNMEAVGAHQHSAADIAQTIGDRISDPDLKPDFWSCL